MVIIDMVNQLFFTKYFLEFPTFSGIGDVFAISDSLFDPEIEKIPTVLPKA